MKQIIRKFGLIIVLLLSFFPAAAYDFMVDGIYYNIISQSNLEVEVTYKGITIQNLLYAYNSLTGSSDRYEYVHSNKTYSGNVVIPDHVNYNNRTYSVTTIGKYAFGSNDFISEARYFSGNYQGDYSGDNYGSQITSVVIPGSVTKIKEGAFRFCTTLNSVSFSEGLKTINAEAFADCPIKTMTLPSSLKTIADKAFIRSKLNYVDLSCPSLTSVGSEAFSNNSTLSYAIIGANVNYLPSTCFKDCSKLLELFMLPMVKPDSFSRPGNSNSYLEIYVPSISAYGLGKEYISFSNSQYEYSGTAHNIEWSNNLKAYKCEFSDSECKTQINAGNYTQNLKFTYSNGVNFTVEIPYKYTIKKAPLDLAIQNAQREYGDSNPSFTYKITGFVNGENEASLGTVPSFECEANQLSSVGTYPILASLDTPNYDITYKYGTLNITEAPLTIGVVNTTKVYGDNNPNFEMFYSGLKNGEAIPTWISKPSFNTDATLKSNVGTYPISISGGQAKNYNIDTYVTGNLTITKAPLELIVNDVSREYYDVNPEFTYRLIGLKNDDDSSCLNQKPQFTCGAIVSSDCGKYAIEATNASSSNYEITYKPGNLTITKAQLAILPNDIDREYGDENPPLSFSVNGLKGEDSIENIFTCEPSLSTTATIGSSVGEYVISSDGGMSNNYNITYSEGKLSVTRAPIVAIVNNADKTYGDANPEFSCNMRGLKLSDTESSSFVSMPAFSCSATKNSSVGEYPIEMSSNGYSRNYEIVEAIPGTLTVEKRNLIAKAIDCERLYGEQNPSFAISYTGFVNGDNSDSIISSPYTSCSATSETNAGTYPIVVTGGDAENYSFEYQSGVLTINPLSVGFKNVYNTVEYNDMAASSNEGYFNYIPEITGPFNEDDFSIELWFMDGDNRFSNHVATISSGEYSGNYVNTNYDRRMWAGKYIYNLISRGTNPNVVANPSRAYLTITRAATNLEWESESPINIRIGETVDLGISYQADIWCTFDTEYNEDLILLSSNGETGSEPHWFGTGLKEGETILYFSIICNKNDMGFYDFDNSRTLYKKIKVVRNDSGGIDDVQEDQSKIAISSNNGNIIISGKSEDSIVRVFNIQGLLIAESTDSLIRNLHSGIYIVKIGNKTVKINI